MRRAIYILTLILITVLIWVQLYRVQFLEYDDNFGQLIVIFLASLAMLVIATIMILKKSTLVRGNLVVSIVFLIINSPVAVAWVAMNYKLVFGTALDVG